MFFGKFTRKIFPVYIATMALGMLLACSKKPATAPAEIAPEKFNRKMLNLQDSLGQMLFDQLQQVDTSTALNSTRSLVLTVNDLVQAANINSQGIAIEYRNSMRGGIMIDALDGYPIMPVDTPELEDSSQRYKATEMRPGSLKSLFLCPIYRVRKEIADSLLRSAYADFSATGYQQFTKRLADLCDLKRFNEIEGYGIIHIYSYCFAWPNTTLSEEVYLMSGQSIEQIETEYQTSLEDKSLAVIYVPGRGNTYFLAPSYFNPEIDLSTESPLVYLGFGNSFNTGWKNRFVYDFNAGALVGFDGPLGADQNLAWSVGMYDILGDTSQPQSITISEWYNSIDHYYQYGSDHITNILFEGAKNLVIWSRIRINELSRYSGKPMDTVGIRGYGFEQQERGGEVYFGQTPAPVISWSDTLIKVLIPWDASEGPAYVMVWNMPSNKISFKVHPYLGISSIIPDSATVGDTVRIIGGGFGDAVNSLHFGSEPATEILSWTDTLVTAEVPVWGDHTTTHVKALGPEGWTPDFPFMLLPAARLYDVDPVWGKYGDTIQFIGDDFGDYSAEKSVCFNGFQATIEAEIAEWGNEQIKAIIPHGAVSGKTYVNLNKMLDYRSDILNIEIFGLSKLEQAYLLPRQNVILLGSGFGESQGNGRVLLNQGTLNIISWNESRIEAGLDRDAGSGEIFIQKGDARSNSVQLYVLNYKSITPFWVLPGDPLYIYGNGFGNVMKQVYFPDSIAGEILMWSDTLIKAITPEGSRSGIINLQFDDLSLDASWIDIFHMDSISPSQGKPGDLIGIFGTGFLPIQGDSYVTFNQEEAEVKSWSYSRIEVYVPPIENDCQVRIHIYDYVSPGIYFQYQGR
jgi:hypothetical protein